MGNDAYAVPPRDFLLTRDWLSERYGEQELPHYFRMIQEEAFYQHRAPKGTIDPQLDGEEFPDRPPWKWLFPWGGSPGAFAALIKRGRVYGVNGAVVTSDHRLLSDVSHEWISSPAEHSLFQKTHLPPLQRTAETVAVLDVVGGENYFHWMIDLLPRLDLVRKSKWPVDEFVVRDDGKPFQKETLQVLGVPDNHIIRSHPDLHLQAERLIVPSRTCESKWAYEFLRREFLPHALDAGRARAGSARPERLYVSRERAEYRTILNEAEVEHVLQQLGFRSVVLEELSVLEQVALFAEARTIVSLHGAGLTNLAFCNHGTTVVEMFSPRFFNPCFWNLCNYFDLDYCYFVGSQGERPARFADSAWYYTGLDNVRIDADRLAEFIKAVAS